MNSTIQENLRYGGDVAAANPVYVVAMLLAGICILVSKRDRVMFPLLAAWLMIPYSQAITAFGIHFQMFRFLIAFGWLRVIFRSTRAPDAGEFKASPIDKVFVALSFAILFSTIILYQNAPAILNALGETGNALGAYFLLRYFVRTETDVVRCLKVLVLVAFVAANVMLIEQVAHINVYGYLGGERLHPLIREGRLRSQAFFGHAISAGCFGATLVPLCVWLWATKRTLRTYSVVGIVSALVMILTSASGAPIMGLLGALLAFAFWPLRSQMSWVRRGLVIPLWGFIWS